MALLSNYSRAIGVIAAVAITIISFGFFFYQQNALEKEISDSVFSRHRQEQIQSTENIAERISADLRLMQSILQGLAGSSYLQQGQLYGVGVEKLMAEGFKQINDIAGVDLLFIADDKGIVKYEKYEPAERSLLNMNVSYRKFVQETKDTLGPIFSNGYVGIDGKLRIALTSPIISRDNDRYIGLVGAQIPATEFFRRYGNVYDIESQYLAVLDNSSAQLVHPVESFIGKPFFGNVTQEATDHNDILNNLVHRVMSGSADSAIYEFKNSERLNTGYPIVLYGRPDYSVFVITPTKEIYSQIKDVLFNDRLKMLTLLAGAAAAILVLIVFLFKWNSILNKQVTRRTRELEESNRQLKYQDKLQNEFVNTAAHELRTPIQPILGISEHLISKETDSKRLELLNIITRNARRLHRLSEDVLDVAKIESHNLILRKERFNINDVIDGVVQDYKDRIRRENEMYKRTPVDISFTKFSDISVNADKLRIGQVISNLLDNSLKFTISNQQIAGKGNLDIASDIKDGQVQVTVSDTGSGIDSEVLPRLFSRFASKSYSGTGLGLYLCKKIVESHGGSIAGKNNPDGRGATFTFSLPLDIRP